MSDVIKKVVKDGFTIVVEKKDDDDPDLSHLGEYYTMKGGAAVPPYPYYDRALEKVVTGPEGEEADLEEQHKYWNPREYRYITLGSGDPDYLEQDAKRLESYGNGWCCVGVVVTATRSGVVLGRSSVWGIESDSDKSYFEEMAEEMITDALEEAKENLEILKTVEDKDNTEEEE